MSARAGAASLVALLGLASAHAACVDEPWTDAERALLLSLSPPRPPPPSPGNHVADDPGAARLGRALFFDRRFSRDRSVSCASCHVPERYFTDGRARAHGVGSGTRNTPGLIGAAGGTFFGWDGAKDSLWAQALGPLEHEGEHGATRARVVRGVAERHRPGYEAVFGPLPASILDGKLPEDARPVPGDEAHPHHRAWSALPAPVRRDVDLVFANAGKAIEAYLRLLSPGEAPFDRYVEAVRRGDEDAEDLLSEEALRGLRAFLGGGQCVHCHGGPRLTDGAFHNLGLPPASARREDLLGRAHGARAVLADPFRCGTTHSEARACDELSFLEPSFEDFVGAFKTPSLRNVAETAPYMHGGQLGDLRAVVEHYRTGGGRPVLGHADLLLARVDPDLPVDDVVAFLETLTGPLPDAELLRPPAGAPSTTRPPAR